MAIALLLPSLAFGWTLVPCQGADSFMFSRTASDGVGAWDVKVWYDYKGGSFYVPAFSQFYTGSYNASAVVAHAGSGQVNGIAFQLPSGYAGQPMMVDIWSSADNQYFTVSSWDGAGSQQVFGAVDVASPVNVNGPVSVTADSTLPVSVAGAVAVSNMATPELGSVDATGTLAARMADQWEFNAITLFFVVAVGVYAIARKK
jgi:hypothetical protein